MSSYEHPVKNAEAVAVYDTEQKKLVLLFASRSQCGQYLFPNQPRELAANKVKQAVAGKFKNKKNIFGVELAFREVSQKYNSLLQGSEIVILDPQFDSTIYRQNKSSKAIKIAY